MERNPELAAFFDQADILRRKLLWAAVPFLIIFVGCFFVQKQLFTFLKSPLLAAAPELTKNLHFTSPLEVLFVYIQMNFIVALLATSPVWLAQIWSYVGMILRREERKFVVGLFFASLALFLGGCAFCYYWMMPVTLEFLIGYGAQIAVPLITIQNYFNLLALFVLSFGLVFELPVLMVVLSILGLVHSRLLRSYRAHVLVVILVVAAILTPSPDPMSQVMMATPMYVLFELGLLVMMRLEKGREKAEANSLQPLK